MTWCRRDMLQALGLGGGALAWAFGCGAHSTGARGPELEDTGEMRTWLRDAVARLATTFPAVHALAVIHTRTTAAIDVLGTSVARARRDGLVLTVREPSGRWREHVINDLRRDAIRDAVRALANGRPAPAPVQFPRPPTGIAGLARIADKDLRDRVAAIARADKIASSRIVYAAAMIDIDDTTLWSIGPTHDREQRVRRIRTRATRAAWNGARPVISEVERGWAGEIDEHKLEEPDVSGASAKALLQMTPGTFDDGERIVILDPGVTAAVVDIAVRGLLTSGAARRPEVARRLVAGEGIAAPLLDLVDDPTAPRAYGGFAFDDEGEPAAPIRLLQAGRVTGRLADRAAVAAKLAPVAGRARRAGHLGPVEALPSHLALAPGTLTLPQLSAEGWLLEGRVTAAFDPASDRIVLGVARARELRGGSDTGRVFANIELITDLAALLARIDGVGQELGTMIVRDDRGAGPIWRSIAAPHVRTRGVLRGRRLA